MSGEALKAKVIRFTEETWNKGDLAVMDEVFAPDVVSHVPGRPNQKGLQEYKERLSAYRADYPDIHVTIDEIIAEGNTVVDRWTLRATFTGPGSTVPIPGNGKRVVAQGTWVGHFVDGKVVENWYTYDALGWAQQIGLIPAPPPPS